jgi:hypothetical protein
MRQRFMLSVMQIGLLHHASPTSLCTEILANPCFAKYMATKLHCSYTLLVSRHASSRGSVLTPLVVADAMLAPL